MNTSGTHQSVGGRRVLHNQLGLLLHEMLSRAARVAVLVSPVAVTDPVAGLQAAASQQIEILTVNNSLDVDLTFSGLVQKRVDALLVSPGPFFRDRRERVVRLASRHRVPAIYAYRADAEAGGLMSYEANNTNMIRTQGEYVGRILKGEKPADLPVQRATKFDLVINLKTAKALSLTIPETLEGGKLN